MQKKVKDLRISYDFCCSGTGKFPKNIFFSSIAVDTQTVRIMSEVILTALISTSNHGLPVVVQWTQSVDLSTYLHV